MWGELYDQADSMGRAQAQLPCSYLATALQPPCSRPPQTQADSDSGSAGRLRPSPCAQAVSLNSALEERGVLPTLQQPEGSAAEGSATEGAAAGAASAAPPPAPPPGPAAGEADVGAAAATLEGGGGPKASKSKKKKKKKR